MQQFLITYSDDSYDWVYADTWEEAVTLANQLLPDELTIKSIKIVD